MDNMEDKPTCSACSDAFKETGNKHVRQSKGTIHAEQQQETAEKVNIVEKVDAKEKSRRRSSDRESIFGKFPDILHSHPHGKERKTSVSFDQEPSQSTDNDEDEDDHPEMAEYWLISAPGDKTCQQTFDSVNNLTAKQHSLCTNYKFHIPDLKVGTLDQLVGLSDDLGKLDAFVEQVTRKVASYLGEVLEDQRDKLHENLMANNTDPQEEKQQRQQRTPKGSTKRRRRGERRERGRHCQGETISRPFAAEVRPRCPARRGLSSFGGCGAAIDGCLALLGAAGRPPDEGGGRNNPKEGCECHGGHNIGIGNPRRNFYLTESNRGVDDDFRSSGGSRSSTEGSNARSIVEEGPRRSVDGLRSLGTDCSDRSIELAEDATMSSSGVFDSSQECDTHNNYDNMADRRSSRVADLDHDDDEASADGTTCDERLGGLQMMHNHPLVGPADLPSYLTRFQWDIAKYPIKQSLRNIADIISKQVGQIENDLKSKSQAYNNLKGNLQSLEKKQTGSLLTRNLADLVKKEHFILDSEYLQTLLVIVPKAQFQEWNAVYEKITDMIVPRSSVLIHQDNEYGLFTVTLFKKVMDEFKLHAREKKFIVRDFIYNEEELAAGKNEITKLVTDKKKQFGPLVRWLKVNFSECFCAWIHVKALRVFVESVLRYGLPVNFQSILMHPHKKTMKRLRDVLNQHYGHLDGSVGHAGSHVDNVDIPGLGFGQSEYYPYVFYKINVDMIEQKI